MIYRIGEFTDVLNDLENVEEIVIFDSDIFNNKINLPQDSVSFLNLISNITLTFCSDLKEFEEWAFDNIDKKSGRIVVFGLIDENFLNGHVLNYCCYLLLKFNSILVDRNEHALIPNVHDDEIQVSKILNKWIA